uniref:Secreted peptide n=1 Tax=Anopheles braziliensis TaxID=58242 RepID=A0A2M3ZM09_9DIPT
MRARANVCVCVCVCVCASACMCLCLCHGARHSSHPRKSVTFSSRILQPTPPIKRDKIRGYNQTNLFGKMSSRRHRVHVCARVRVRPCVCARTVVAHPVFGPFALPLFTHPLAGDATITPTHTYTRTRQG